VYIRNLQNELTKTLKVPNHVDNIFYAGTGLLLLRTEDSVALLDIQRKEVQRIAAAIDKVGMVHSSVSATLAWFPTTQVQAELAVAPVKYVVWSNDMQYVALISKHCTVHRAVQVVIRAASAHISVHRFAIVVVCSASDHAGHQEPGAARGASRDDPHQERRMGRHRHFCVHDTEPPQIRAALRVRKTRPKDVRAAVSTLC